LIINADTKDLYRDIEEFLSGNGIEIENIPVTILVNPPIRTVIENVGILSEILIELLAAYRTEGSYFLKLYGSPAGIVVTFGIEHAGTAFSTNVGHC
jgi:hypothetical protein